MSYCRWSSMNWMCDVYVYESTYGGWVIHVAARKRLFPPIPDIPHRLVPVLSSGWDHQRRRAIYPSKWRSFTASIVYGFVGFWHSRIHMASLRLIPMKTRGLPHDGKQFCLETPGECAEQLRQLRGMGYTVPEYAIQRLLDEQKEIEEEKTSH